MNLVIYFPKDLLPDVSHCWLKRAVKILCGLLPLLIQIVGIWLHPHQLVLPSGTHPNTAFSGDVFYSGKLWKCRWIFPRNSYSTIPDPLDYMGRRQKADPQSPKCSFSVSKWACKNPLESVVVGSDEQGSCHPPVSSSEIGFLSLSSVSHSQVGSESSEVMSYILQIFLWHYLCGLVLLPFKYYLISS